MKTLAAVTLVCLLAVLGARAETYPAEYDNLDVNALLQNKEKVVSFGNCLLDDAKCSDKARPLRVILLDAFNTGCSNCNEPVKEKIRTAARHYIQNEPDLWKQIVDVHDPQRTHAEGFKAFMQG